MTTPCKFIARDSQGVRRRSSEPREVSVSDMWVSQRCMHQKTFESLFSQKKKVPVLSMINSQWLTPSATWLAFGVPS